MIAAMTLDDKVQYLLDRAEIQDVLALYARGQDDHQEQNMAILEDWDRVFTPDATVDYAEAGPPFGVCPYAELARIMRGDPEKAGLMSGSFHAWQHMLGLPTIKVDGDRATARTDLLATHTGRTHAGTPWHLFDAAIFHDDLVRTPQGWRIKFRRLQVTYVEIIETLAPGKNLETLIGQPDQQAEGAGA
jgi:SnoaL-like domain